MRAPVWHANPDSGEERIALWSSECHRECCGSASERRGLCLVWSTAAKRSSAAPKPAEGSPFAEPIAPTCSGTIDRLWSEGPTQPPMQLATPVRSRHRCGAAAALPRLPTVPYPTYTAQLPAVLPRAGRALTCAVYSRLCSSLIASMSAAASHTDGALTCPRPQSDGGIVSAESIAFIREATGFARQAQSGRAVPRGCTAYPTAEYPNSTVHHGTPQHTY